jgi:hypothetical protein
METSRRSHIVTRHGSQALDLCVRPPWQLPAPILTRAPVHPLELLVPKRGPGQAGSHPVHRGASKGPVQKLGSQGPQCQTPCVSSVFSGCPSRPSLDQPGILVLTLGGCQFLRLSHLTCVQPHNCSRPVTWQIEGVL